MLSEEIKIIVMKRVLRIKFLNRLNELICISISYQMNELELNDQSISDYENVL